MPPVLPDARPLTPEAAERWSVFIFATMRYDAPHARMHALVEASARLGFEAVYVESPNSRSAHHPGRGAPTLNAGGLRLSTPTSPTALSNGTGVLCVPKKLGLGPLRIGTGRRSQGRLQGRWLAQFFERYRGATNKRILAIVSTARWEPLLRDIAFDALVFDKLDPPETLRGRLSMAEYLEREDALVARSTLVLAITRALEAQIIARNPQARTLLVPNGVSAQFFDTAHLETTVPELANISGPIAGFLGTVAHWVDIDLFEACARAYPDWTFVLAGPINGNVRLDSVERLPNVRIIGRIPYDRVPAVMHGFDVALMPFRPGIVSDTASPVTLYELLALGKPVVCTPLPDMEALEPLLYMSREDFVANVARAGAENDPQLSVNRRTAAAAHDWDRLAERVFTALPL